jgi:hypothetical protein
MFLVLSLQLSFAIFKLMTCTGLYSLVYNPINVYVGVNESIYAVAYKLLWVRALTCYILRSEERITRFIHTHTHIADTHTEEYE